MYARHDYRQGQGDHRRHAGGVGSPVPLAQCGAPRVRGPRPDGVQAMLQGVPGVKRAEIIDEGQAEQAYRILPKDGQPIISAVSRFVHREGWDVVELSVDRGHLDEVFRSLTMPAQALT